MLTRREVLRTVVLCGSGINRGVSGATAAPAWLHSRRPPPGERTFNSAAVESRLREVQGEIADPELAWLFGNCYPNTLDTAITLATLDGKPDTFVVTGDIPAMWLRDSAGQVWPYVPLAREDARLRTLFRGVIHRQARCILIDPYANAFQRDLTVLRPLPWAAADLTEIKAGVAERKWEIDSLCHPIRLAHGYWKATGDVAPFDSEWLAAMQLAVATFDAQRRLDSPGPYRFQRRSSNPLDTLLAEGFGAPTRKVGLVHSMFRPSDDACTYPFLIPANLLAIVSLRRLASMVSAIHGDDHFASSCSDLARGIESAAMEFGVSRAADRAPCWAYEVDGYGNQLVMDDANLPSLLALPYLGYGTRGDSLYQSTRALVWGHRNPYFVSGTRGSGIGSPHVGERMIWPMSLVLRALTGDDEDVRQCLAVLRRSHAGTGFMHESFSADDPGHYTRPWFAWANSLFGELIVELAARRSVVLRDT